MLTPFALLALSTGCTPNVPTAPATNNPEFSGELQKWSLIGDAISPDSGPLTVQITAPSGVESVDLWFNNELTPLNVSDGGFTGQIDLSGVGPGSYKLIFAEPGAAEGFASTMLMRSHPLYVLVSIDWDAEDTADVILDWQVQLHERIPSLRLTHFVGPYHFTAPSVSAERATVLASWLTDQRDTHNDEIGLHIHPYCHFIEAAGLDCITTPSLAGGDDPTGFAIPNYVYDEDAFYTLLDEAERLFVANGLGVPTAYRAGGWTTELHTLQALERHGFLVDSSALNWSRMEEWQGTGFLYEWNKERWAPINETSQPYFPSLDDIAVGGQPALSILEVPDNGILADYVDENEMIEMLIANWGGTALTEPRQFSMGYHNTASNSYRVRVDRALDYAQSVSIEADNGPVVFATVSEMAQIWTQ